MIIEKNKVVSLEYHLTNDDGETIDSNRGGETLDYLHGVGNLIKGLEEALEGKQAGEEFSLSIPPEKGYGARRDELVETVARHEFEDPEELEVGMEFELPIDEENTTVRVVISEISGDEITIDANHELAGMNLNFEIRVDSIRDASPLEIENQHALVSGENHSWKYWDAVPDSSQLFPKPKLSWIIVLGLFSACGFGSPFLGLFRWRHSAQTFV